MQETIINKNDTITIQLLLFITMELFSILYFSMFYTVMCKILISCKEVQSTIILHQVVVRQSVHDIRNDSIVEYRHDNLFLSSRQKHALL